ncbi:MAG TPA: sulfotransferase [Rhizomicrobium sp.]|nr:sulfotransferase [Rhizomicrobium sp.]
MALKVIGAGFGRTGTMSLKLALEQLGFVPCYHMMEVFSHPGHAERWEAIARGAPADWHEFLSDYEAAVDWPASHFYRELAAAFPDAKVILTERDPEKWYASISQTIFESIMRNPDNVELPPERRAQAKMGKYLIGEQTFANNLEKTHVLDVYRRHNEEVKRVIPRERLLVYDAPQGWAPLCEFLGVPVPQAPYPRTNSTDEFRARAHIAPRAQT